MNRHKYPVTSVKRPFSPNLIRDLLRYLWLYIVLYVVYIIALITIGAILL